MKSNESMKPKSHPEPVIIITTETLEFKTFMAAFLAYLYKDPKTRRRACPFTLAGCYEYGNFSYFLGPGKEDGNFVGPWRYIDRLMADVFKDTDTYQCGGYIMTREVVKSKNVYSVSKVSKKKRPKD